MSSGVFPNCSREGRGCLIIVKKKEAFQVREICFFFKARSQATRASTSLKILRGPKLEGYAFANFGYSSETDGKKIVSKY